MGFDCARQLFQDMKITKSEEKSREKYHHLLLLFLGLCGRCNCNVEDYGNRRLVMKCRMMRELLACSTALEGLTELGQLDILHPHLPDTDYKLPFKRALFEVVFAFTRTARLMDLRQRFFFPASLF